LAFLFAGDDGAVADGVGGGDFDLDVAFVADVALRIDVTLDVVGVHAVGSETDGVFDRFAAFAMVFGHDDC